MGFDSNWRAPDLIQLYMLQVLLQRGKHRGVRIEIETGNTPIRSEIEPPLNRQPRRLDPLAPYHHELAALLPQASFDNQLHDVVVDGLVVQHRVSQADTNHLP
jgi:hypothetical protein